MNLNSLNRKIEGFEKGVQWLLAKDQDGCQNRGTEEAAFFRVYKPRDEVYRGIQVLNDGLDWFELDRQSYLKHLQDKVVGKMTLKGPVHKARADLFDYENWDAEPTACFLTAELKIVSTHYAVIFTKYCGEDYFDKLVNEWSMVVSLVQANRKKCWRRHDYLEVWEAAYKHSTTGNTAQLLIEIEQSTALDTSCAERWFSLMARLKDKRRNRMNQELLSTLMFFCLHAPKDVYALKKIVDEVRIIWAKSKDRYKGKWVEWKPTVDEMEFDELEINNL